jgi:hypothetical protein
MDADGSNKQKVIDVDNCDNVQFIPNSDKILYLADNSLYTVNIDGTENVKISGELDVIDKVKPSISYNGEYIAFNVQERNNREVYNIDVSNCIITNISNTVFFDEFYPKFSKTEDCLCYSSNSNELNMIINFNVENLEKDTLYTTNNFLGDVCYSIDSECIYFTQRTSRSLAILKKVEIATQITEDIAENINTLNGGYFDVNEDYFVLLQFSPNVWVANSLETEETVIIGDVFYPFLSMFNSVLFSDEFDSSGDIYIFILISEDTEKLTGGKSPIFSQDCESIVYISRYITNPKSKNLITN